MRPIQMTLALAATAVLTACTPTVPDSGAGVGFADYEAYAEKRERELQGQRQAALPPPQAIGSETLQRLDTAPAAGQTTGTGTGTGSDIAAETQAALAASRANSGELPVQADPNNPAPEAVNSFGISREQDFSAVDEQRSIDADKARLAQVRSQYQQVEPSALPSRTDSGPNIVSYALSTTHQPGQSQYSRGGFNTQARYQRNCAKYPSPDLAQTDFLKNGGPQSDRMGLDPDGDGFACSWDPRPFRTARGG